MHTKSNYIELDFCDFDFLIKLYQHHFKLNVKLTKASQNDKFNTTTCSNLSAKTETYKVTICTKTHLLLK